MSVNKRNAKGGYVNPSKLPQGPNGRALCRWCGTEVPRGKRTFCSERCIDEHMIRTSSAYARTKVGKRDNGICALCGLDTYRAHLLIKETVDQFNTLDLGRPFRYTLSDNAKDFLKWLGIPTGRYTNSLTLWDADHIIPVVKGGGGCGLDNLRTLCIWCHRDETKKLKKELSHVVCPRS